MSRSSEKTTFLVKAINVIIALSLKKKSKYDPERYRGRTRTVSLPVLRWQNS